MNQKTPMSDNDIRLAIATACGWIFHEGNALWIHGRPAPFEADADVLNDLNACFEFEATLTESERREYFFYLFGTQRLDDGDLWKACHATARQRCEAFCKVKGIKT